MAIPVFLGYETVNGEARMEEHPALKRTDAEKAASVTPVNYAYPPGDVRRYGAVGDDSTDCTAAIQAAINQYGEDGGAEILFPEGIYHIVAGFTITHRIVMRGAGKFKSVIYAVGFGTDVEILNFAGSSGSGVIDNCVVEDLMFQSNNGAARAITATWVTKSRFIGVTFYGLYRGYVGDHAFLNKFEGVSTFDIAQQSWLLQDECNNCHWDTCEGRSTSSHGFEVSGNCAGLSFSCYNGEGILDNTKAALYLAPATGKRIIGLSVRGSYFEQIAGHAIQCNGADTDSVMGLTVQGNQFFGGAVNFAANFTSPTGNAVYAINLKKVTGWDISDNVFIDWATSAFLRDGTEVNGRCWNNTTCAVGSASAVAALTSSSNLFSASVDVQNNFAGRKVQYMSSIPTTGSYTAGDLVRKIGGYSIDANNMVLTGWGRITTGSSHTVGTDWARLYASHNTPAT